MLYPSVTIRMLIASFLLTAITASHGQLLTNFLQNNSVNGIAYEDETGDLLFATSNGLWRFNGRDFSQIPITIKTLNGVATLPPEEFTDIAIDHSKRVWVGSKNNGLFIRMGAIWKHVTNDSGAPSNHITDLFVDSHWRVWIGTTDQGVGAYDGRLWHRIKVGEYAIFDKTTGGWIMKAPLIDIQGPFNNHVNVVHEDKANGIWIGSMPGARRFGGMLDSMSIIKQSNWCFSCLDDKNVLSFANGPDGTLWTGTSGQGVFLIQPDCNIILTPDTIKICAAPDIIPDVAPLKKKIINDIEVDFDGNFWFGANDSVCRYNPLAKSFRCLNENDFPSLKNVKTVFRDPDNNLWFGISERQGVIRLNNNWFTFGNESLPNLFVFSLLAVKDTLWVGTANGIRRFKGEARVGEDILRSNRTMKALAPDEGSQVWIWIGAYGGGIYSYYTNGNFRCELNLDPTNKSPRKNQVNQIIQWQNEVWIAADSLLSRVRAMDCSLIKTYSHESTQRGLINDQILAIAFDQEDRLWCGTPVGVSILNPGTEQWDTTSAVNINSKLIDKNVTAIAVNPANGEIWVGTGGGGILIYGKNLQLEGGLSRTNFLADNSISQIVFSGNGEVWVATPRGVSRRDRNGIWCTYDTQSGLASDNVASIALQGDSLRWFGTYGAGLTRYRPPQTLPKNFKATLPETFIETRFDVTDKSEVTYRFSAADLNTAPNEFRYRYALDDNTRWSEPTSDRFAVVTGITPGPHTFYVQAIDRDGNLDLTPDTDFFSRIDPGMGGSSIRKYATGIQKIDTIAVSVYWPPNLLSKDTEIIIDPIGTVKPDSSTLFAFSLTSNTKFRLRRPMTLSFSFLKNAVQGRKLGIFRKNDEGSTLTFLGGTPQTDDKIFSISTAIQDLGIYNVGERPVDTAALSDSIYHVNAQPRIFSPKGGGHGEQTTISFQLDESNHVRIQIYNLAGRLIKTLKNEFVNSGIIAVPWDGKDKNGEICPTGLYIITIESNGFKKSPPKPLKVMVLNQ